MTNEAQAIPLPEQIDPNDQASLAEWAGKLAVTPEQLTDAIGIVGTMATDVEMHLKGSRTTTNADRMQQLED